MTDYYTSPLEEIDAANANLFLKDIRQCTSCPLHKEKGLVCPGWFPELGIDLLFVGMSPGEDESKAGRPFVGRAGHKLMSLASSVGLFDDLTPAQVRGMLAGDEDSRSSGGLHSLRRKHTPNLDAQGQAAGSTTVLQPNLPHVMDAPTRSLPSSPDVETAAEQQRLLHPQLRASAHPVPPIGDAKQFGEAVTSAGTRASQEREQAGQSPREPAIDAQRETHEAAQRHAEALLAPITFGFSNVVRCHTPSNRPPTGQEIEACKRWLDIELDMADPLVVILLGNSAIPLAFPGKKIGEVAGDSRVMEDGRIYIACYHPAAVLHRPDPYTEESIKSSLRLAREFIVKARQHRGTDAD